MVHPTSHRILVSFPPPPPPRDCFLLRTNLPFSPVLIFTSPALRAFSRRGKLRYPFSSLLSLETSDFLAKVNNAQHVLSYPGCADLHVPIWCRKSTSPLLHALTPPLLTPGANPSERFSPICSLTQFGGSITMTRARPIRLRCDFLSVLTTSPLPRQSKPLFTTQGNRTLPFCKAFFYPLACLISAGFSE